jgi:hypothetical protein
MMDEIVFYNHFHNGDVHYSREFCRHIGSFFPKCKKKYVHGNHPKLTRDLWNDSDNFKSNLGELDQERHVFISNNTLFINTWIGNTNRKYLSSGNTNCSMYANMKMWNDAFEEVRKITGVNVSMREMDYYVPSVDYSSLEIQNIDPFLKNINSRKKILIVNSDVMSGQSVNFSFDPVVNILSEEYPEWIFFLTNRNKTSLNKSNVVITHEFIRANQSDIMENSYLSTKCDIIVGRGSGVFCTSCVKENYLSDKKIFGIGHTKNDSLWYPRDENKIYTGDYSVNNITNILRNIMKG